ncbi:MAG TPA: sodium/solute symporter, partial [Planctomycetes bacterium]|nr:sodium/solute symporter [Planctomycetota bacterium]
STEQFVGMAGQGAGSVGLAVSNWQLVGSIGIVVIAFTLLPRFLKAGIYTMPEYLEYRYNSAARALMALTTVVIYIAVLLTAVLYSGGLTLHKIFDMDLTVGVWLIGLIAAAYTAWGGLKAVAWADLFQGGALLLGGVITFFLGLHACGGWEQFSTVNRSQLHMVLAADHEGLPWTGVFSGMWIVIVYYCGLNQFIVQRNLAAKTLRDGQLGVIFAGALWLLIPFAIVMPGIMSNQLYGDQMAKADEAFPMLIRNLVPAGLRGFMFAAIAGAVISSLASMLNSASTIFTMDVYNRMFDRDASQKRLLLLGRVMTLVFIVAGCLLAPRLDNPKFGGVFQYIQQFQGYIWPGAVAAFLFGMMVPKAPGLAGVAALISGPIIYGLFQAFVGELHFLIQVAIAFLLVLMIMGLITFFKPLDKPKELPVREDIDIRTTPEVKLAGGLVLAAVAVFYIIFW